MGASNHLRVGGRDWSNEDLAQVREAIEQAEPRQRTEIARRVCRTLLPDPLGRRRTGCPGVWRGGLESGREGPVDIYLYPLRRGFRHALGVRS